MGEMMGFGKIKTSQGFVDINLLSDDEEVFAASANAIAGFAVETGGLLHPTAKGFFKASIHNVDNAKRSMRVMSQVMRQFALARTSIKIMLKLFSITILIPILLRF